MDSESKIQKREIKFRVWAKSDAFPNGKMYCSGDEVTDNNGIHKYGLVVNFSGNVCGINQRGGWYARIGLNEIELMQFTGLLDSKGAEIFEGDILTATKTSNRIGILKEIKGVVEYDPEVAMWMLKEKDCGYSFLQLFEDYTLEILGNRFEHPELLGEKR